MRITLLTLTAFLLTAMASWASDHSGKPPRTMNYYPDGGDIVCVNGRTYIAPPRLHLLL